ncbi:MAG: hypothetical protein AB7O24_24995 [Kofleriaceae bacterium]
MPSRHWSAIAGPASVAFVGLFVFSCFGPKPPQAASPVTRSHPTTSLRDLSYLPADSAMVIAIDLHTLRHTDVWRTIVAPLTDEDELDDVVDTTDDADADMFEDAGADIFEVIKKRCGFDLLTRVKRLTMAVPAGTRNANGDDDDDDDVVDDDDSSLPSPATTLVIHGIARGEMLACIDELGPDPSRPASRADRRSRIDRDGDVTTLTSERDDKTIAFAFLDETTALAIIGPDATADRIRALQGGQSGLDRVPGVIAAVSTIESQHPIWVWAVETDPSTEASKTTLATVNVSNEVQLEMRVIRDEHHPDRHRPVTLDQLRGVFETSGITQRGSEVRVVASTSSREGLASTVAYGALLMNALIFRDELSLF